MTNFLLTKDGVVSTEVGTPKYFFRDEDFSRILKEPEIADSLFQTLGKCCIGRLGEKNGDNVYVEKEPKTVIDLKETYDRSYYAKI